MRGKELELEQAAEAYRNLQWLKQQSEEKERSTLREKDTIISQLQAALQTRSQETQVTHTHTHSFVSLLPLLQIVCCNFQSFIKTGPRRQTCAAGSHKYNRCADAGVFWMHVVSHVTGSDSRPRRQSSGRTH